MRGDALRVAIVVGAVAAAVGSTTKQSLQASYYTAAQPISTAGCEKACDQISACELATYEPCFKHCRESRVEQQPNGPQRLDATAKATCDDLAARMQPQPDNQPPLPTFGDPHDTTPPPPAIAPPPGEPPR